MNRRILLTRIVQGFSVVGAGFLAYPFIKAFLPVSAREGLEVDVSGLRPGESRMVHWQGRNVFVVRRTAATIRGIEQEIDHLKDPDSRHSSQPEFARNPGRSRIPELFVAYANCTHLGCEVALREGRGFVCPCHDSKFDASGRVYREAVASLNLQVPNYKMVSRRVLVLLPG